MKTHALTDLHCHLLPEMDDGARDVENSLKLIETAYESGIKQIMLTSHFDCEKGEIQDYVDKRKSALNKVGECLFIKHPDWKDLRLKLGAEVNYSPSLVQYDLKPLCMEGTTYLLMELPGDNLPAYFDSTIQKMIMRGVTPIIAHVERYRYIMQNPLILCDWIDDGIIIQMNAESFLKKNKNLNLHFNLVKWNLVHIIASDAHSLHRRPVNLKDGLNSIKKKLGPEYKERVIENSNLIFNNHNLEQLEMYCPRKILGRWR